MDDVFKPTKVKADGANEASSQAHSYAKMMLDQLHDGEVWTLAKRLDAAMLEVVKLYVDEIRK